MLTQLSHNSLGRINLRPLDVDTSATGSLSPRSVLSADVFMGRVTVQEYGSTDGSLYQYTYALEPAVELRKEHESEGLKMMLMLDGHLVLKEGLRDDSVVTQGVICLFRSRCYTIALKAQLNVRYLLFDIEPLAKRLQMKGFEEGRYEFTEMIQAQVFELLQPPRILGSPDKWLSEQLEGILEQLKESMRRGKRLSPKVYHLDFALAADKFIQQNLLQDHTTQEIARQVGLNDHALKIAFSEYFGMGMARRQNWLRVEMAKNLLRQPGKLISEIAEEVGYKHRGTFTTNFGHVTGLKPVEWRQKYSI
ncbi:helix-turn-helix domain-containing protein [Flavihumibacter fluvii]|uniref:helix-turn-helix domain-containing protein n=1 Tax=Flavihumibacter fluvii TaxID=2838157 RepID=UPI001BDE839C|nr:AraC family transcriptional regulator [Flavihumibacter fluvii]ULQ51955.1 AraC family transcriptional regulator [Flavihumibacter fluvii]